ncbi:MAG: FAD-dependent monooxygenase [Hyphomonas sp.]
MTDSAPNLDTKFDLAIVGAGPAGASLAILAAKAGFSVCLIDARDNKASTRRDTRTFAVVAGSWRMLGRAGVHDALADKIGPLNGLEAVDGGKHYFGAPSVFFDLTDLNADSDEPLGQMVPAQALQAALDEQLTKSDNLTWLKNAWLSDIETTGATATISTRSGHKVTAGLVAACDGVNSPVRNALNIPTVGRPYGQSVFAADVRLEIPHNGIARQLFTPEGPFATLPMPDNCANLAWYMKTGAAEALAKFPVEKIEAQLNERFGDFAGPMKIIGAPLAYPLHLQLAERMIGPRTALVGDAAHRINPLAGQGLNLGFKDVAALIEVMEDSQRVGLDPGAETSLKSYEEWRRIDTNATALFMDAVDRLFTNDNPVLKPIRSLALTAANTLTPIRRAMAKQASADQATLPRLMQ